MRRAVSILPIVIGGVLLPFCAGCGGSMGDEMPVTPNAEWGLVVFGDSSAWGIGDAFAACLEEDLGVKVTVHDMTAGGEPIARVLRRLREDEGPREVVENAEVITFYGNPLGSNSRDHPGDWGNCVNPSSLREPGNAAPETFDVYEANIRAVIDEILALRGRSPTVLRAMDAYVPVHAAWRESGVYDACWLFFDEYNQAIHRACAERNVPVARVYDAFNGPDHHEDPRDKGYISADGVHTSMEGRKAIGDAFRALGYAPVMR